MWGCGPVVADALNRKSTVELTALGVSQPQLIMEFERLGIEVVEEGTPALLYSMTMQPDLLGRIKDAQVDDPECQRIKKQLEEGKALELCKKRSGAYPF